MSKSKKSTKVAPNKKNKSDRVRPASSISLNNSNSTSPTTTIELANVIPEADLPLRIRASIEEIFGRYDADGNGSIDSVELEALLRDVNNLAGGTTVELEKEAQEVLSAIGKDKGQEGGLAVDKEDFIEWTLSKLLKGYGGGLLKQDRTKPGRKLSKALPQQLERFLSSMGKVSMQIASASSDTPRLCRDFRRYLPHEMPTNMSSGGAAINLKLVDQGVGRREHDDAGEQKKTGSRPTTPAMSIHQTEAQGTIRVACELLHLQIGLRILFEQFGHHDKTINAGMTLEDVHDVFRKLPIFYEKVKTAFSSQQTTELELSLPNICTAADVPKVFRALDANGNGKIEMREFSDWFVAGSIRTPQQQVSFYC